MVVQVFTGSKISHNVRLYIDLDITFHDFYFVVTIIMSNIDRC